VKQDEEKHELAPEYDFSCMKGGIRGKYADAYRQGTNLVRLDPDVARSFTTDEAVNEALRAVLKATSVIPVPLRP